MINFLLIICIIDNLKKWKYSNSLGLSHIFLRFSRIAILTLHLQWTQVEFSSITVWWECWWWGLSFCWHCSLVLLISLKIVDTKAFDFMLYILFAWNYKDFNKKENFAYLRFLAAYKIMHFTIFRKNIK